MIKLIAIGATVLTLQGCAALSTVTGYIPSFWDDNQSSKIIDIRQNIEQITCEPGTQLSDATYVKNEIQWFRLYSESKGSRQKDVLKILAPMEETVSDWAKRSETKEGSKTYCELKKKTLQLQSSRAAEAILGRY
jgi:hypothetical protein